MIYGRDIADVITAHQLGELLLAGPDLPVRVPDVFEGDEVDCVGVGRLTHDTYAVYLCGYFLGHSGPQVSETYGHQSVSVSPF